MNDNNKQVARRLSRQHTTDPTIRDQSLPSMLTSISSMLKPEFKYVHSPLRSLCLRKMG
jgi:hypothetical protein